jgi:hypothetical protein
MRYYPIGSSTDRPSSDCRDEEMDLYEVLQVSPRAEPEVIQAAYRRLALKYHPDTNSQAPTALQRMTELNRAYEVLSDPSKRAAYDRKISRARWVSAGTALPPHSASWVRRPFPLTTYRRTIIQASVVLLISILSPLAVLALQAGRDGHPDPLSSAQADRPSFGNVADPLPQPSQHPDISTLVGGLLFTRRVASSSQLSYFDFRSKTSTPIPTPQTSGPLVAAFRDGSRLIFTNGIVDSSTGALKRLTLPIPSRDEVTSTISWSMDGYRFAVLQHGSPTRMAAFGSINSSKLLQCQVPKDVSGRLRWFNNSIFGIAYNNGILFGDLEAGSCHAIRISGFEPEFNMIILPDKSSLFIIKTDSIMLFSLTTLLKSTVLEFPRKITAGDVPITITANPNEIISQGYLVRLNSRDIIPLTIQNMDWDDTLVWLDSMPEPRIQRR